jgi:hypothetical protein
MSEWIGLVANSKDISEVLEAIPQIMREKQIATTGKFAYFESVSGRTFQTKP